MLRHYLQWHIIHRCNLQCVHCYQDDYDAMMTYDQMIGALDKYEKYIGLYGYEGQINLTGGEPLLHPDFMKLSGEIRNRGIRLGILTNGTLIDEKMAQDLASLSPVLVQVSLDGPEEIHDSIRGKGQYKRAIEGIDHLVSQGIKVNVSFTAMKHNIMHFEELARELAGHGIHKLWWDRVVTDDETLYLSTIEFRGLVEKTLKLQKKYKFISNDRALQQLPKDRCGYNCSAGKRLLILLAGGELMACRRLPFIIGSIYDDRALSDIIHEDDMMKKLSCQMIPDECRNCKLAFECRGGARCVTYAETGRLDIKDLNCWL